MSRFNWSEERKIYAACGCNTGLKRTENEDNLYFGGEHLPYNNDGLNDAATVVCRTDMEVPATERLFAVFDGIGGAENGEVASYVAAYSAYKFLKDPANICNMDISPSMVDLCISMNEAVTEEAERLESRQMGSTFAGLFFGDCYVWCCNLGDSRCYIFRNDEPIQLSEDHTIEYETEIDGHKEKKPYITQFLGVNITDTEMVPSVSRHKVREDDVFLICSDGLTDMVTEERISEILSENTRPEETVKKLIAEALANGGGDNVTVIICKSVFE